MRLLLLIITLLTISCSAQPGEEPAPVIRPQQGSELCDEVCEKAKTMTNSAGEQGCLWADPFPVKTGGTVDCEEGSGLKDCITCAAWCVESHQDGVFWNTSCIMQDDVTECEQVDSVCNIQ